MPTAWAQSCQLRWRPELRFYESRTAVLRDLESAEMLTAFRVGESDAGAQLGDAAHQIEFSHRGLIAYINTAAADTERVLRAIAIAIERLEPKRFAAAEFTFQHVVPLEMSY